MIGKPEPDSADRTEPALAEPQRRAQAERESAAVIGFISAIAAYGAFYIPKAYGSSIQVTGTANAALWGFLVFYVSCLAITWVVYTRKGGLLHDVERAKRGTSIHPAAAT